MNKAILASVVISAAACGEGTYYEDNGVSMSERMDEFEASRSTFDLSVTSHETAVMAKSSVSAVAIAELNWSHAAEDMVENMSVWLQEAGACRSESGERVDLSDTRAALNDLRLELLAHQHGMLTQVDVGTAHATEGAFQARQALLVEELRSHYDAVVAVADSYSCAF